MRVILDDIEYDVPGPIAKAVQERNAYKFFLGGKTPGELIAWLNAVSEGIKEANNNQRKIDDMLSDLLRKLGHNV